MKYYAVWQYAPLIHIYPHKFWSGTALRAGLHFAFVQDRQAAFASPPRAHGLQLTFNTKITKANIRKAVERRGKPRGQ
jgi:hypothetical protein